MILPKFGRFRKLAEWWVLKLKDLLVAQDPWREKEPRNSSKVKKASFGGELASSNHRC